LWLSHRSYPLCYVTILFSQKIYKEVIY
jgi:hypothetical protein